MVKDRESLQNNLSSYINEINNKFENILVAPIAITLGDEWQLITNKPSEAYNLVHEFQQLLWKDKVDLYAGIGIGGLSTPPHKDVRNMDGSCFHAARDAINVIKNMSKLKNKYSVNKLNKVFLLTQSLTERGFNFDVLEFYFHSKPMKMEHFTEEVAVTREIEDGVTEPIFANNLILEKTLNLIIENNEILKAKMTDKQKTIYINYIKQGSYRKVVEFMEQASKETIGGISQKLNNASYFTIQRNQQLVSMLLDSYCGMGV
jgi:hypothetical protein